VSGSCSYFEMRSSTRDYELSSTPLFKSDQDDGYLRTLDVR
jgi:hypothetical protein